MKKEDYIDWEQAERDAKELRNSVEKIKELERSLSILRDRIGLIEYSIQIMSSDIDCLCDHFNLTTVFDGDGVTIGFKDAEV